MPNKITRFSPRKHFGHRTKRRKLINFEKVNPYSLDKRVIQRKVDKTMQLFRKHYPQIARKQKGISMRCVERAIRMRVWGTAVLGTISKILSIFDSWHWSIGVGYSIIQQGGMRGQK